MSVLGPPAASARQVVARGPAIANLALAGGQTWSSPEASNAMEIAGQGSPRAPSLVRGLGQNQSQFGGRVLDHHLSTTSPRAAGDTRVRTDSEAFAEGHSSDQPDRSPPHPTTYQFGPVYVFVFERALRDLAECATVNVLELDQTSRRSRRRTAGWRRGRVQRHGSPRTRSTCATRRPGAGRAVSRGRRMCGKFQWRWGRHASGDRVEHHRRPIEVTPATDARRIRLATGSALSGPAAGPARASDAPSTARGGCHPRSG